MGTDRPISRALARRMVVAAWVLALPYLGLFIWLSLTPGHAALVAAQIVYLLPVALAALAAEFAHSIGTRGIERRAWGLLSLTVGVLLISEGYYSWQQVFVSASGPPSLSVFDALNTVAALMLAIGLAQLAGVGLLQRADAARLGIDLAAFSAVTFAFIYRFMVVPIASDAPWWETTRWAGYSLTGVLVMVGALWLVVNARAGNERRMSVMVAFSFTVFASGMMLWPIWRSGAGSSDTRLIGVLVATIYLLGYYLLMMAGLVRIRERDGQWRIANTRLISTEGVWASTLLSFYVLAGVACVGVWVYEGVGFGRDTGIFLTCALLATVGLVARTGVTAIQTVAARSTAEIDGLTGALDGVSFLRHVDEAAERANRRGEPASVIVFNLDGFSVVNSALGHSAGDRVLADVAAVTSSVAGERGDLFRLSADEFALVGPMTEAHAVSLAAEVLAAIRGLEAVDGVALSASIGVATCEGALCASEELVQRARAAEAWAKYHGKARVVRYDARMMSALGVEERLRAHDDRAGLNLARALVATADARDPRNYYHARNVAALAVLLSDALHLEPDHIRAIELAAMLHDIGKLELPDTLVADVLRSARQQVALREHATIGETLTCSVGMPGVASWVRHHHERWDGAGYPDGLAGDAVPLESRIIALADAYDAMTSTTRTRTPMSRGAALQEIDLGMGSRFDPTLAELFIEVVGATASLGWSDEWVSA